MRHYVDRIKERFPPDRNWKQQRQPNPPIFGWARMETERVLDREVERRREWCREVLADPRKYCDFVPGKVSIIVLSCKRWDALKRLIESMVHFWREVETYQQRELVLVDNGSGEEMVSKVRAYGVFDRIIAHQENLGMLGALKDAYRRADGEYILYFEDDFYMDYERPFLGRCLDLFNEFPEIGIIRLKDQNNWWKPQRRIAPVRYTSSGEGFRTWLPSRDGMLNGWCAGSVIFRKVSYFSVGEIPQAGTSDRKKKTNHAYLYEYEYGKEYNKRWLAAKMLDCCPFVQPNDNTQSPGWG